MGLTVIKFRKTSGTNACLSAFIGFQKGKNIVRINVLQSSLCTKWRNETGNNYVHIQEYAGNVYIRSHTQKDQHSSTIKYTSLQFYFTKEYYHDYKQVRKPSQTSLVGKIMLPHQKLLLSINLYIPQPSYCLQTLTATTHYGLVTC